MLVKTCTVAVFNYGKIQFSITRNPIFEKMRLRSYFKRAVCSVIFKLTCTKIAYVMFIL